MKHYPPRHPIGSGKRKNAVTDIVPVEMIEKRIYLVRAQKVMLDSDLACSMASNQRCWCARSKGIMSGSRLTLWYSWQRKSSTT